MPTSSKHWVFTLNNYEWGNELELFELVPDVAGYVVYGREVGERGTRHLQGYIAFRSRRAFGYVQSKLPEGCHIEARRGRAAEAIDYCKKDGDYEEFGVAPVEQGHRSDIDMYKEWLRNRDDVPSEGEIASEFTALFMRYRGNCLRLANLLCKNDIKSEGEPYPWQQGVIDRLDDEPNDRSVEFYVDSNGGSGKSWLIRYLLSTRIDVQVLSSGSRNDLAFAVDETKRVFLFDIARGGMEFLPYGLLEKLKDRYVFSPKYESQLKILKHKPHVFVFCNEHPDMTKMTADRYIVTTGF